MTSNEIVDKLNRLYKYEIHEYVSECESLKKIGYRIFRNSNGEHRIIEPVRPDECYNDNDIYNAFGGIFRQIFGGDT